MIQVLGFIKLIGTSGRGLFIDLQCVRAVVSADIQIYILNYLTSTCKYDLESGTFKFLRELAAPAVLWY